MVYIGCDPAFRKNGFALCIDDGTELRFLECKNYTNFLGWLLHDSPETAVLCVENSNLQKAFFHKNDSLQYAKSVGKNQEV